MTTDDIVTKLRKDHGPSECWTCGEWGCLAEDGSSIHCNCDYDCSCEDKDCSCTCHSWYGIVHEAAIEIERLRRELDIYKGLYAAELVEKAVKK
jgi:hypothetical protein